MTRQDIWPLFGMNDYVSKPIRVEALVGALSRVLVPAADWYSGREQRGPASEPAQHGAPPVEDGSSVLERAALAELFDMTGKDFDFLVRMLDSYLATSSTLLEKLKDGVSHHIVVDKHGGKIAVRSQPGSTCFEVRLPIQGATAPGP